MKVNFKEIKDKIKQVKGVVKTVRSIQAEVDVPSIINTAVSLGNQANAFLKAAEKDKNKVTGKALKVISGAQKVVKLAEVAVQTINAAFGGVAKKPAKKAVKVKKTVKAKKKAAVTA